MVHADEKVDTVAKGTSAIASGDDQSISNRTISDIPLRSTD